MIRAATFVLGGLVVLSAMGPLHFALGVRARYFYQQCIDAGFENHCMHSFEVVNKYACKKLVCAQNEGGTMIAIDTGKKPDEGTPCRAKPRTDDDSLVTKICIKGVCRRIVDGLKREFEGDSEQAVDCWNRKGELFTGGPKVRPEKCPNRV